MIELTQEAIARDAHRLAALALAEDGARDLTTEITMQQPLQASARIEFRAPGVLAGLLYADAVAAACQLDIVWTGNDGSPIEKPRTVGTISGDLASILRAERPLLNLLQRASGIATVTAKYVHAIAGTGCRVLHTRKTAPGLRMLDLSAVLAGGGELHRIDLASTVMMKDNHWAALAREGRSLADAVLEARHRQASGIYVEVESLEQVRLAVAADVDRLLIDNQSPHVMSEWARLARARKPTIEIEATGGITLENAREYAAAGADFISTGALTHSVPAADIAVEIER